MLLELGLLEPQVGGGGGRPETLPERPQRPSRTDDEADGFAVIDG